MTQSVDVLHGGAKTCLIWLLDFANNLVMFTRHLFFSRQFSLSRSHFSRSQIRLGKGLTLYYSNYTTVRKHFQSSYKIYFPKINYKTLKLGLGHRRIGGPLTRFGHITISKVFHSFHSFYTIKRVVDYHFFQLAALWSTFVTFNLFNSYEFYEIFQNF